MAEFRGLSYSRRPELRWRLECGPGRLLACWKARKACGLVHHDRRHALFRGSFVIVWRDGFERSRSTSAFAISEGALSFLPLGADALIDAAMPSGAA